MAPRLDDPRWLAMKAAIDRLAGKVGSRRLARSEIANAIVSNKLISTQRDDGVFVWGPEFEHLFGGVRAGSGDDGAPSRIKRGPKPRGDWPTELARWLIELALEQPSRVRRPNITALAADAQNILSERIGWAPEDIKVLRAKIRELLPRARS